MDGVCFTEKLTFLKYVNEHYLFYSITILTFASLFSLVWILKKYTYFEKNRITRATLPTFPYGNFGDVIKGDNSLHVFLWKNYNRFKRKGCKFGGLFLFTKPVILLVDPPSGDALFVNLFPPEGKLNKNLINRILTSSVLEAFLQKYNYSIKGAYPEKFLKTDTSCALKDLLLESVCLMFGFNSFEMVEEINQLLRQKYASSLKYYLSLCLPCFLNPQKKLSSDLKELLQELMEERKKNDVHQNDLVQSFMDLYNESQCSMEDVSSEAFCVFTDTITYSYSTAMLCLYELANSDEIQEEVVGEIRRFNKENRKLTGDNLGELVYVEAVVKETLRKYPPVATTIKSTNGKNGTDLQWYPDKNGLVFQSVLGIHRDPQFYTKPEAFDPDRFMEKTHLVKCNSFIPFGLESRSDLYMKLISLQVTLVLVGIFSRLQVKIGTASTFKYNPRLLYLSPCEDLSFTFHRI